MLHEWIIFEFDGIKKNEPSVPGCNPLLVRFYYDGIFVGTFCSHSERNDVISRGIGEIEKDEGSWEVMQVVSRLFFLCRLWRHITRLVGYDGVISLYSWARMSGIDRVP